MLNKYGAIDNANEIIKQGDTLAGNFGEQLKAMIAENNLNGVDLWILTHYIKEAIDLEMAEIRLEQAVKLTNQKS